LEIPVLSELTDTEREVLLALLAHLAESDARIDPQEVLEIDAIAEEMGIEAVRDRLMRARAANPDPEALVARLAALERRESRELIRTVLFDLARSDGEDAGEEVALLEAVTRALRTDG
jgi:uncharacterized tellurite resistance protein B-like protein